MLATRETETDHLVRFRNNDLAFSRTGEMTKNRMRECDVERFGNCQ
ncbi:MAG: hypothetical protein QG627_1165 [Chlamydiota bacterium]|jgi:hypothetical protein|nr:hypothetical protein [Chlamydiota bacterium]